MQILSIKLYPPRPFTNLVERDNLANRLDAGLNKAITIIVAPPGFGKTTLLSAWLSKIHDKKMAWYSLDEDDNDASRFFAYIAASLRPLEPVSVPTLDSLLEAGSANPRELTVALLNDLSEFSNKSVLLVLDDYHHITSQAIHEAIAYLIDHLPSNIHLVFTSRADPPLPLGRWRVRGQLAEIRADDLRFTEEEAAQFLNRTMGLSLDIDDIRILEARTEGWVAGLQLAALSLQNSEKPREIISAFAGSNRYVAEYLTDEVLSRQPGHIREFLLKTSVLDRFNGSLCDHVLQTMHSDSVLAELNRSNLFIIPLDSESNWYRYHHLFADLLRRRLEQADQDQIPVLHFRAAEWFEKNQYLLAAIRHWIAADQPDHVAALMEQAISRTWGQADSTLLMKYVEKLPASSLAEYPALSAFLGWTWLWLGHGGERILPLLDHAEEFLQRHPNNAILGRLIVVRSFISRVAMNNSEEAIRLAQLALEQLAKDDLLWRGFAQLSIAIASHSVGYPLPAVEAAYGQTIELCQAKDPTTAWIAACARVQVIAEQGDLSRALASNRQLLDTIRKIPSPSLVRGWAHVNQAILSYQFNDLESAWREVHIATELEAQTGGMPDVGLRLYALLTRLELLNGNESAARKAAEAMIELAKRGGVTNAIDWSRVVQAELFYDLGEWTAFDAWAREYRLPQQPLFFAYRKATLFYIRYLSRQKNWDESRRLVDEQVRLAREAGYVEYEMELFILRALLEMQAGRSSEAIKTIEKALKTGMAGGYMRVFVDEGAPTRNILGQAQKNISDESLRRYCARILSAVESVGGTGASQGSLIEPLTEREIDVLKLIAEGMSNPEIAEKLFLSVGTVKTHVKHIYAKLNVDDRVKAASKAREMRLLD